MNLKKILVIIIPLIALSCSTESVKTDGTPVITIASDYLTPADTTLFKNITDSLHCSLRIRRMNTDQLIGEIRNNRFNSGIDLVMMKSPYDVNRLNKLNIFQPLRSSELRNRWKDYNVIPIAVDPFVIIPKSDSIPLYTDSSMVSKSLFLSDEEDLIIYLSYNYQNADPIVVAGKIRAENEKYILDRSQKWRANEIITLNSQLKKLGDDSSYVNFNWAKRTVSEKYNVYTIGILNQPENYKEAVEFIRLFRQNNFLKDLLNAFNLDEISVHDGSTKLVLEDQIQYFTQIERALR